MVRDFLLSYTRLLVNNPEDISLEITEVDEGFDEITIFANLDPEGRIREIRFDGHGCSISMASASMMTEKLAGMTVRQASDYIESFREMMRGNGETRPEDLGDVESLLGVRRFPVRVKCATLAWSTTAKALERIRTGG